MARLGRSMAGFGRIKNSPSISLMIQIPSLRLQHAASGENDSLNIIMSFTVRKVRHVGLRRWWLTDSRKPFPTALDSDSLVQRLTNYFGLRTQHSVRRFPYGVRNPWISVTGHAYSYNRIVFQSLSKKRVEVPGLIPTLPCIDVLHLLGL